MGGSLLVCFYYLCVFVFRMGKKVKKEVEPPPKDVVSV